MPPSRHQCHPAGYMGRQPISELEATGGRFGLQTMCEGGGTANATLIEILR